MMNLRCALRGHSYPPEVTIRLRHDHFALLGSEMLRRRGEEAAADVNDVTASVQHRCRHCGNELKGVAVLTLDTPQP